MIGPLSAPFGTVPNLTPKPASSVQGFQVPQSLQIDSWRLSTYARYNLGLCFRVIAYDDAPGLPE